MAVKLIRQFMATSRHRLPTTKEELKAYIAKQFDDLKCVVANEQIEALATEFEKQAETPVLDTPQDKVPKPLRRR